MLTPTVGVDYFFHNGDYPWVNRCDGCIPDDVVLYDREMFEYMRDKCGYPVPIGGKGEAYLDYMTDRVLPAVNNLTSSRLLRGRSNFPIGILAVFEMCLFLSVLFSGFFWIFFFWIFGFFTGSDSLLKLNRWRCEKRRKNPIG